MRIDDAYREVVKIISTTLIDIETENHKVNIKYFQLLDKIKKNQLLMVFHSMPINNWKYISRLKFLQ